MILPLLLLACSAGTKPSDTGSPPDGGGTDGGGTDSGTTGPSPVDADGDGWSSDQDCDDDDPLVHPGAVEICSGKDDNCDGLVDNDDPDVVGQGTFYADADEDGHGDPTTAVLACEAPDGYLTDASDCLDSNAEVHPAAEEICSDGLDNDCDGTPADCLLEGTWELSNLASTVWRADDAECLEGMATGDLGACPIKGASMVSSSLGGQDLDGDGRPDLLVHSSWRSVNLVVPLDAPSGLLEEHASAWLSYANIPTGGDDCDTSAMCKGFRLSRAVGDWNADGFQDLAVASFTGFDDEVWGHTDRNVVSASLGPFTGDVDLGLDSALLVGMEDTLGDTAWGLVTMAMSAVPSVDGEGDDLVIGAHGSSPPRTSASGSVYLVADPMRSSTNLDRDADAVWYSDDLDRHLGSKVASLGDTDGDGVVEIIAFADQAGDDETPVRAWVVDSSDRGLMRINDVANAVLFSPSGSDTSGWAPFPTRQDIDGDGLMDVVIADPSSSLGGVASTGSVYILQGPISGEVELKDDAWARFDGERTYCYFGQMVDVGTLVHPERVSLAISGIGRHSPGETACTDPARVATWYEPQAGVWTESTADLRIDMRIGWDSAPDGRESPALLSHAQVDGVMTMVLGMGEAGWDPDGYDVPGFIALAPLPGW